jgi:hypothetical protein
MAAALATCAQGAGSRLEKGGSCGGKHRCVLAWPLVLSTLHRVHTLHATASVRELGPQIKIDPGIVLSANLGFHFPDNGQNKCRAVSTQHALA